MKQWKRIKTAVRATRGRRWAWRFLQLLVFLAVFGSFLANDRPLIASYRGEVRFPVFREVGEHLFGVNPYTDLPGRSWKRAETDWAIWPPIPYAASTIDGRNANYKSPFGKQRLETPTSRHWMGTDRLGRDVFAGMIKGARTALLVGIVAMSVALLIGLLLGGIAGYFGNNVLRSSRWIAWTIALTTILSLIYIFGVLPAWLSTQTALASVGMIVLSIMVIGLLVGGLFYARAAIWPGFRKQIALPLDSIFLRLVELFNSVPALVLLITVLGVLAKPNILTVMLIIGLVRWTTIARFVRAELLRIRSMPYLEAARLSGFSHLRILVRHALPNALGPVIVALAFGMAGAVLLEAFLAFLSVGLPPDEVSWGSLLLQSRSKASAWWLAVFPGLAIFLTVLSLNVLGEALSKEDL